MHDNDKERILRPVGSTSEGLVYATALTPKERTDPVYLHYEPRHVLPVVFVPGIMGSNLRGTVRFNGGPVWRLDTTYLPGIGRVEAGLAWQKRRQKPGDRQNDLHPDRTKVDGRGAVPSELAGSIASKAEYTARGWGEVGEGSYHAWLLALEKLLNDHRSGGSKLGVAQHCQAVKTQRSPSAGSAQGAGADDASLLTLKGFVDATAAEIAHLQDWHMPVYACGYNWLQDNSDSAQRLADRIRQIIKANHDGKHSFCKQVVLVTHSMGGLVARACAMLPGMEPLIAGVVHGVMPAHGAAVAYRRCKVGMQDEDAIAAIVIGKTGQHVTPVFAQSPGALELLPTQHYGPGWLEVQGLDGKAVAPAVPQRDPYEEIYQRRDRWWALVKEEWLAPKEGMPITWGKYLKFLSLAETFHRALTPTSYHPHTYAFYGADNVGKTASFERVVWRLKPPPGSDVMGLRQSAPSAQAVYQMTPQQAGLQGENPEHIAGKVHLPRAQTGVPDQEVDVPYYDLVASKQDGRGDGTVPASSGRAPAECAAVKQVFRLTGIEHEGAYRHATAQQVAVYSLVKIAQQALWPEPATAGASRA
ncbi:hypothetical protein [Roseateles sp.]|uniref:esterase/lipase family protein n=1 Tax=Roseateles sp. TaxID=1971397 RepID=UPI002E0A70FE|nr:hypothetical protein [Roseateles sp.]